MADAAEQEELSDFVTSDEDSSDSGEETQRRSTKPKDILGIYQALSSRRVDLIGDYAGNELFLIEGDSLLLECFNDRHLDFDTGCQMLHATYLVEQFLQNLVRRKCNFHIAFFDDHRALCVPEGTSDKNTPKYLLTRTAIIHHLKTNLSELHPAFRTLTFASITDDAFTKYLSTEGMYFMMCHDGARRAHLIDEGHAVPDKKSKQKLQLRSTILAFIKRGYNVALINEMEWKDTKAMTMVLEGPRRGRVSDFPEARRPSVIKDDDSEWVESAVERLKKLEDADELNDRERVTVLAVSQMLSTSSVLPELGNEVRALLLQTSMLDKLSLSSRHMDTSSSTQENKTFLHDFVTTADTILRSSAWLGAGQKEDAGSIIDLLDGRLFNAVLSAKDMGSLPYEVAETFQQLCQAVNALVSMNFESGDKTTENGHPIAGSQRDEEKESAMRVLPFSNDVFDKHLKSIHLSTDENVGGVDSNSSARIFKELTHWHNAKKPIVAKGPASTTAKDEFWALKRNQWFMAEMQKYAASLTNATGKSLDPETVVVGTSKQYTIAAASSDENKPTNGKDAAKKGGAKAAGKSGGKKQAMLDNIAATNAKRDELNNEKLIQAWHSVCKGFAAEKDLVSRYAILKDYLVSMTKAKRDVLGSEVQLYMLSTLLEQWILLCKADKSIPGMAAMMWNVARTIPKEGMTKTVASSIELTVETLKIPKVSAVPKIDKERKLPFKFALPAAGKESLSIDLGSKDFQLLHCGPYIDRSIDSAPDSRVEFEPDAWQRRVLDGIDANRSLVVVAPTSAGKTFISFYAMRKILEADDDGVLVYVAPTKALVNQIAAEIQARYSKKFKYAGKSVWAIHTRDYRINNPTGCQVLVTVPHVLQIMLLAPSHANSWASRVKRIIFDEVHSIGNAEDGVVWEQLLLLSPCPIIALSATVGNPEEFSSWLESTQDAIGHELEMIQHKTRYSDLRKFYYRAPKQFAFTGLGSRAGFGGLGLDGTPGFAFVHPVASLINKSRGIPDDLSLEPRDCLTLWQAMTKHQTKEFPVPADLDPAKALPPSIRKIDTLAWEEKLKNLLRSWMESDASPFDAVLAELGKSFREGKAEETQTSKAGSEVVVAKVDTGDLLDTTLPMLCRLHEQDALPAIFFNYERGLCERICQRVVHQLQEAEKTYKESSPKWQSTLKAYEEWKAIKEKAESKKSKTSKVSSKKGSKEDREDAEGDKMSKTDMQRDAAGADSSIFDRFNPDAPVEGFHFADHKKVQLSELELYVRQLGRRNIQQWLIDAIGRGVGVHHAGMNRKYRQVVEILFRKGFLRVVIATGTLALGINMPCKTVVFSGDSVFLTALNFRQGAGRAGRRGFDLLGNVVFQNISEAKVCRLLSSRLPDLNGHFPITTTLVLRLFTLLHESKKSAYAVKAINTILSQPRLYMGGPEFKDQTLHHLRFSIEYLRRQQLLDSKGATLNFAGLVSHLYFTENASFAFHALLKEGYFHRLCANIDKNEQSTIETLMLVMAHLFGRVYCRQSEEEYKKTVVKPSSSIVFLPSLPEDALQVLQGHSEQTLDVFKTYVQTFVQQHIDFPDDALPLTGLKAGAQDTDRAVQEQLVKSLNGKIKSPTHIRSAFVALSGYSDDFSSIPDLCQTARSGVFLEESVIPHVGLYPQELKTPLNAYLLDFFKHGDINTLERANKVRKGDVWFLLNDFSVILATIVTSLMNFMKLKVSGDLDMLDIMGNLDSLEEAEDDKQAVAESDMTATPVVADPSTQPGKPITVNRKKAKAADSWEDVADEEDTLAAREARKVQQAAAVMQEELGEAAWEGAGGEQGLLKVLKAFQKLHAEYNTTFRKMWA